MVPSSSLPNCRSDPRPAAPSRTQFVCQRVVGGRIGGLAEGSQATIYLQILVDRRGVEPLTSAVQRRRSPN